MDDNRDQFVNAPLISAYICNKCEKEEEKYNCINLSSESLCAIIGMYECMKDPGRNDWENFQELLRRNYKDVLPS